MIFEKRITALTGKFDSESPEYSVTYKILTDDWRDGPFAIAFQGCVDNIHDQSGKVLGWLKRGKPWKFGNEFDSRVAAESVEVSDRKVIDSDEEYEIHLKNGGIEFNRSEHRTAVVQWTVKQNFKKRSFENHEPEEEPDEDDMFTLKYAKEFVDEPFLRDVRTGKSIVNSAGDPFLPTPVKKSAIRSYTLVRKERRNQNEKYDLYENVVNKDKWHRFKPGTILMESITPDWDGNIFTVTYSFKYKKNGWGEKFLDTGLREAREETITVDGQPRKIKKHFPIKLPGSQTPVEEPVKLDGKGRFPIRRETKLEKFIDLLGNPVLDPVTGEILHREDGAPVPGKDAKDRDIKEVPYTNYPGIDLPYDPPGTPEEQKQYFWKFAELEFASLKIPDPYKVEPKPMPTLGGGS